MHDLINTRHGSPFPAPCLGSPRQYILAGTSGQFSSYKTTTTPTIFRDHRVVPLTRTGLNHPGRTAEGGTAHPAPRDHGGSALALA
jgi:hypothetical protein